MSDKTTRDEAPTVARHSSGAIDDFMDNPYAGELFSKLGPGKMDILTAALREGQDLGTRDNGVQRVMAIRAIQSAVHDLAENRDAIPFDDSTGLGVAKEVSSILFSDPDVARRVNEALDRQDVLERESPGTHTAQVRAREIGITKEPSEGREV